MDLMTILGWVIGFAAIVLSIALGENADTGAYELVFSKIMNFWDAPSVGIVVGGTITALMVSYPGKSFAKIGKHLKIVLFPKKYNPSVYIDQIVTFAKEARMNGLLAIEDKLNETEDIFLKNALMLVVDSVDPDKVKTLLETELDYFTDRHVQDMSFYSKASDYAPAFGMIGTLIGLINLLKDLSDQESLATNMGVALITTFYGVILANLIFKPIANKLRMRHEEEYLCRIIISEGVMAIQDGDNPKFIEEKLMKLLPSSATILSGSEGDSPKKSKKK